MKNTTWAVLILFTGLFIASCGGGEQTETMEDTTNLTVEPVIDTPAAPIPDTVNGIDTTVNLKETQSSGVGKPGAQLGK